MRRSTSALTAAVLGTALSATSLVAQQAPPGDGPGMSGVPASVPGMRASRGARYLLRNGWDYLKYQEYERALSFFREAEAHKAELNDSEKQALAEGVDRARRGMREAADGSTGRSYARSGAPKRPGAMVVGRPAQQATAADPIQLTSGTNVAPAAPRPSAPPEGGLPPLPVGAAPAGPQTSSQPAASLPLAGPSSPSPSPAPAASALDSSAPPPIPGPPSAEPGPAMTPGADPSAPPIPGPPAGLEPPAAPPTTLTLTTPDAPAPPAAADPDAVPLPPLAADSAGPPAAAPAPAPAVAPTGDALPPLPGMAEPAPLGPPPAAAMPATSDVAPASMNPTGTPITPPAPPETASAEASLPPLPVPGDAGPGPAPAPLPASTPDPALRVRDEASVTPPRPDTPSEFIPERSGSIPSTLSPELQREVERIAQKQEEDLRRNGPPDREPAEGMSASPASPTTRLEITRAPSPTEARPIRAIPVPDEFVPLTKRDWAPNRKYWSAAATCHLPLYFQDASLERYGHSTEQFFGPNGRFLSYPVDDPRQSIQRNQITQPLFSAGLFAAQIALLPYNLIMDPPWEAEYDLGYYRPGDRVPTDVYYLPLTGVGPPLHGKRY